MDWVAWVTWFRANGIRILVTGLLFTIGLLAAQVAWSNFDRDKAERRARSNGFAAIEALAEADSTRKVADAFRRLARQREIERDSLAQALADRPVVQTTITVDPDTVVVEATRRPTVVADTLEVEFSDELLDAVVRVDVARFLWATMEYDIKPIPLMVTASCGPLSPELGLRPANIQVRGPDRLNMEIVGGTVTPEVCNPPPVGSGPSRLRWAFIGAGAVSILSLVF